MLALAAGLGILPACASRVLPDPRATAQSYRDALDAGDAERLHALLSEQGQQTLSEQDVKALLARDLPTLRDKAHSVAAEDSHVTAEAELLFHDGRRARLSLEDGAFRVTHDSALPAQPATPKEALDALARAAEARDLRGLMQLLSGEERSRLEERLDALSTSLGSLAGAIIEIRGDAASVELPDGQTILLSFEGGSWKIRELP